MGVVPDVVKVELDASGLPWTVELCAKHYAVRVQGRLAGILPRGGKSLRQEAYKRVVLNLRSQVRRLVSELKDGAKGEMGS